MSLQHGAERDGMGREMWKRKSGATGVAQQVARAASVEPGLARSRIALRKEGHALLKKDEGVRK